MTELDHPAPIIPRWFILSLVAVSVVGLVLRLAALYLIPTQPVSDFWSFFTRAVNLHDFGVYEAIRGRPDATFPPFYPIVLSAAFWLPLDHLLTAKLVNAALGTAAIYFVGRVGLHLGGPKAGILAASILAAYPRSVMLPVLIASENLFLPLLLVWVLICIRCLKGGTFDGGQLLALGILSALLTLTKSVACILFLAIPAASLALHTSPRKVLGQLAILTAAIAILLLPWGIRNRAVLGRFTVLNSVGGVDLFIGNNPHATGEYYYWPEDIVDIDPAFFSRDVLTQNDIAGRAARNWIVQNPLRAAALYFYKFVQMFSNERYVLDFAISYGPIEPPWPAAPPLPLAHPLRAQDGLFANLLNTAYVAVLVLELLGLSTILIWSPKLPLYTSRRVHIGVTLVAIYFPLVSAVFLAITRFRWPFTDLLLPYAAIAILNLKRNPSFSIGGLLSQLNIFN